jgi:3-hydroxy-D-aspartate aldolase
VGVDQYWRSFSNHVGMSVAELDTPCLLLDLDALEANLDSLSRLLPRTDLAVRPHAKTHKSPRIARMQLARGAVGICCAKLSEAESLVGAGVEDVLVTTQVVGEAKVRRLIGLARQAVVRVVFDDERAARAVSAEALRAGVRLDCLVDVNVGQDRTGVAPDLSAVALGQAIKALKGLRLKGLQGYEGNLQLLQTASSRRDANRVCMERLGVVVDLFRKHGLCVDTVSTAGTGTFRFGGAYPFVTELQPGSYAVMDSTYAQVEGVEFRLALSVLTSVVSRQQDRIVVDAGSKALSTDYGQPRPRDPALSYLSQGDEHGKLIFSGPPSMDLGDRTEIIPSHCDTTINLHDRYTVIQGGFVVGFWPVTARGSIQ